MTATADSQAVRRIARRLLLEAANGLAPLEAARNISAAIRVETGGSLTMLEHTAWFEAVYADVMSPMFAVSWLNEQSQGERAVCGVQLPTDSAQRLGASRDTKCARPDGHVAHDDGNGVLWVSRTRAEQDERDAIDRNVADLLSDENLDAHRISASIQAAIRELFGERNEARELARVSLDILRNVSDEPMRELYGVDDFDEMPDWFTGYGKPGDEQ